MSIRGGRDLYSALKQERQVTERITCLRIRHINLNDRLTDGLTINYSPIFTDVIVKAPATGLSLNNVTLSVFPFSASVYSNGR